MAQILDMIPAFKIYSRKAELEPPAVREQMWTEHYQDAHKEVFEAFFANHGSPEGSTAIARELSRIRKRVKTAAPVTKELIEKLDPEIAAALEVSTDDPPLHVLMVGTFSTNADVGRLNGRVTVFHCLEWFQNAEGAAILIAHEDTHAWHQIALGDPGPENDLAWTTFYEGLAIRASRMLVPDQPENDYYWYGHEGFEEWLPWCREHRDQLLKRFSEAIEDPAGAEIFFGGGTVDGHWRTGFFVADEIINGLDHSLPELVRMPVEQGRKVVRDALGLNSPG